MEFASPLVSPKQVARAIGVSESSLKRWCDQGLIKTVRTAGGHRKMLTADVLRFVREHDHALVSPEVLGLPPASQLAGLGLLRGRGRLVEALLSGDELLARQIVFDLFLANHPISVILDEVVAKAFREIGERWACHAADIYQERRACEICLRTLFDIRKVQPAVARDLIAIGGTVEGDQYTLPSAMAELVLRSTGFNATALGTSIPFPSLITAVQEVRPALFWLSVSHIAAGREFAQGFNELSRVCAERGTALVVGGRALVDELRQAMTYSAYCDTMQHLERFAKTLKSPGRRSAARGKRSAKEGKARSAGAQQASTKSPRR